MVCQCSEEGPEAKVWRSCKTPSNNSLFSFEGVFFKFALGSKLQLLYHWVTSTWGSRSCRHTCQSRWHTSINPAPFFEFEFTKLYPLMYLNFFTVIFQLLSLLDLSKFPARCVRFIILFGILEYQMRHDHFLAKKMRQGRHGYSQLLQFKKYHS